MNKYAIAVTVLMCLILMVFLVGMSEDAYAQSESEKASSATSADKKLATQEGLGNKEIEEDKLPGKLEIGLAIGSIIAMIGVLKYV